jgi:hypothetical protein
MVGAVAWSCHLIALNDAPSASIRIIRGLQQANDYNIEADGLLGLLLIPH